MAVAFTFPGQGSQTVGMGKILAENFPEARDVFAEVDATLGQSLSDIMWNGPEEELTLTANAQPALMAVSMALIRILQSMGVDLARHVSHVAGHSLGEYSALCAAGTFSIADTARLLRIRGNAMQRAVPFGKGAMAAIIGLEFEDVQAVCTGALEAGICQIANDNGGGQIVISGEKPGVEKACALASEKGAKRALMLSVSAPFHSSLMAPAADEMRAALADVTLNSPCVPLIANILAQPVSDVTRIAGLLVEQVTGRVRWRETIEWFAAHGTTDIYEVGSGKVLTGLAKRIDKTLNCFAINSPADIDKSVASLLG